MRLRERMIEVSFDSQMGRMTRILANDDMRSYFASGFEHFVKAVLTEDGFEAVEGGLDIARMVFHAPTVMFWEKMERFLRQTFFDYQEQVRMAAKFDYITNEGEYKKFVKKQVGLINQIEDDEKIDYFAALTRAYLLDCITDKRLYFKLARYLTLCTSDELEFLKRCPMTFASENTGMISGLQQFGLFTQGIGEQLILSDFAKALKENSLNFNYEINHNDRLSSYERIQPIELPHAMGIEEIEQMFNEEQVVLNGGDSSV